jgi:hypothetical protein
MSNSTQDLASLLATIKDPKELLALAVKLNGAAEVAKAAQAAKKDAPSVLSVTMDAIVAATLSGPVLSKDVTDDVTKRGRECGLFKDDESATPTSTAQLIRHADAFCMAMERAGYEWAKKAVVDTTAEVPPVVSDAPTGSDTPAEPQTQTHGKRGRGYVPSPENAAAA